LYLCAAGATLPGRQMTCGRPFMSSLLIVSEPPNASACGGGHPQVGAAAPDDLDDAVHPLGFRAQAADDELLGLEVRIRAHRHIGVLLLELAHQRLEPGLDRECEPQLANDPAGRVAELI